MVPPELKPGDSREESEESPFGIEGLENDTMFGSTEVDWESSETLKEVLDGNPGFEEEEVYSDLPESGSALLTHDLSNYFQLGLNLVIEDESLGGFSGRVHFEDSDEGLGLNPLHFEERGLEVEYDRPDLVDAYRKLREDPTHTGAINTLGSAKDDDLPQAPREVVYRAEKVAKAARGYQRIRGSPKPDASTTLEDAIWAFDKFQGVELDIDEELDMDHAVHGNEALKFISSTLVQNAYESGNQFDTEVDVHMNEQGDIEILYESHDGDLPVGVGEDVLRYDSGGRDAEGLGIPASAYIVEKFEGDFSYEGDEETFRLRYTLKSEE
ncbi:MAG: hypothetical protein ABEK10_01240 [Candidatus Nanosalina sp.]